MELSAISVENLNVSYHGNPAIRNISFSFDMGNLIGVIGPNGAGKSTLLKSLLGLIAKDQGSIEIMDRPIAEMRRKIAYIPQRSEIDWHFPITVLDAVLMGTYPNLRIFQRPGKAEKARAIECLNKVDMTEYRDRQIGELSGGQQQRVFLARALAQQPELFFLDEPFVGVDIRSEEMIMKILKELKLAGKTIIVVHHDLTKVMNYFNQVILLNRALIGYGPVDEIFRPELLRKAYQGQLAFMEKFEVTV